MDDLGSFERAALAQAPPGAIVVDASVSPDGHYGVALMFLPSASYLMDDIFVRGGDRWELHTGGSGGGVQWTWLGEQDRGVLRYEDEAPEGTASARISYQGQEHRVSVRHGYFLFVVWNVPSIYERPTLVSFD